MPESLKNALKSYREYTIKLIENLEKDEFDSLDELLNKRQEIIEIINKLQYKKEKFIAISEELKILYFQQKFNNLMDKKRNELKIQMDKTYKIKNANNVYSKNLYNKIGVFNKKI